MPFAFQMLRPEDPRRAVFKEFHPSLFLYTSTIRRHIVFGRPLFLLPSGVHPRATAQLFAADRSYVKLINAIFTWNLNSLYLCQLIDCLN